MGTRLMYEIEVINGKYCRDGNSMCRFYWENEDGDYGCCLLNETAPFIEGDFDQLPKLQNCPNPYQG